MSIRVTVAQHAGNNVSWIMITTRYSEPPSNIILMPPNGEHQLEKKNIIFDFVKIARGTKRTFFVTLWDVYVPIATNV